MLSLIICAVLLMATTSVTQGKCLDSPQIPDGISVHKEIKTWEKAHQQCTSEGGVLASPINTDLLNAMTNIIGVHNTPYFIGTKANSYPGSFKSVEGVPLDNMTAAVINMVEQLDRRDGDCLSMDKDSIRVVPCCKRLPFMCYRAQTEEIQREEISQDESVQQPTEGIDQTTLELPCGINDNGYVYYSSTGSCYKLHADEKTWDEAKVSCEAEGAHLVVIEDRIEADIIMHQVLTGSVYMGFVGFRDYNKNGDWRTVTGKRLEDVYHEWNNGRPTYADVLHCGTIYSHLKLDNMLCSAHYNYICEKERLFNNV